MHDSQLFPDAVAELRAITGVGGIPPKRPIEPPGPNDDDGGMSDLAARVGRLEDDSKELRKDMKDVLGRLAKLEGKVDQLPTTWVMLTAIVGSMVALLGFTFAILRYAAPH